MTTPNPIITPSFRLSRRRAAGLLSALAAAAMTLSAPSGARAEQLLRMESFPAGSTSGQVGVAFSKMVQKYTDISLQVSVGKAAPKQVLDAASGKTDIAGLPPLVAHFMKNKAAMFKDMDQAPEMLGKVRAVLNYPIGMFHAVVYADSGITELSQIAGKKVFLGPPAGAATTIATKLVKIATGLAPDKDFEVMPFDWASSIPAFLDRQIDVLLFPAQIPSAQIEQFAQVSKLRFLAVPDPVWGTDGMNALLATPSIKEDSIPAGIYANQVNDAPVRTISAWTGMGARADLDEETMYQMISAFWDHIDEVHETAPWMKVMTPQSALTEMNVPLHAGVYRYYREKGYDVPEALIPPEAQ